jgi:hypothetical protein
MFNLFSGSAARGHSQNPLILQQPFAVAVVAAVRVQLPTRAGARTSFFSPELNRFYLAVPRHGKKDVEIRVYQLPK